MFRVLEEICARFPKIFVIGSLTVLDARNNYLGDDDRRGLQEAVNGREGFELKV